MRCSISLFAILGASSLLALGCSGSLKQTATEGSTSDSTDALDVANGGIDPAAKEAPAFNDPAVERLPVMDNGIQDPTEMTTAVTTAATTAGARSFHVLLVWGHLPQAHDNDDADPDPVAENWTGSISVDAGAIGLKRTIAFDENDHIDPRTSAQSLSFDSHTLPYVDGILVRVVLPAAGSTLLHFKTSALTMDIDLASLPLKMGGIQRLATDEEGLAWIGYQDDPGCAKGFVHGRWVKERAAFGRFRGVVSDGDGERIGHVRGLWGFAKKRNANVFFGKYIDRDGDSNGLVAGKYEGGKFAGLWATKDEADLDVGNVEGFYGASRDNADGRGVWVGRWSAKCAK
jgi:hypothetical protein